jgi:hypothetical protein
VVTLAALPGSAAASGVSQLTLRVGRPLLPVPPAFLGVSVEHNELLRFDRHRSAFVRQSLQRALPDARFAGPVGDSRSTQWVRSLAGAPQGRGLSLVT